uniref:L-lactate permease n=1 Tax=Gongylonema pulchrum TaxID=637853 RepID=A0A183DCA1_9BILA
LVFPVFFIYFSKEILRAVPYVPILTTTAVWAIWFCAIANFYYENLLFFFAPTYLHAVLGFHVHDTGFTAALPPLSHFAIKIACGIASDKIRSIGDTAKVKIFNTVAYFGCAVCLFILAFFGDGRKMLCLVLLSLSAGFLGFTPGGFY